jgi:hypothetical protein
MSILTTVQNVCKELSLPVPTTVVGNSNTTVKQLLALSYEVADEARMRMPWPELTRVCVITLVADQANYQLPYDFDQIGSETMWNQTDDWFVEGPITPSEWRARIDGGTTIAIRDKYRIKGIDSNQLFIHPTPDSSDAGSTIIFEYQSSNWIKPPAWANSTSYSAGDYCFGADSDGIEKYWLCSSGGTSSGTAPHDDVGATWGEYYIPATTATEFDTIAKTAAYNSFVTDNDISILHERSVLSLGLKWMWKAEKGLPFEVDLARWEDQIRRRFVSLNGARTLDMAGGRRGMRLLGYYNIPEGNYGS